MMLANMKQKDKIFRTQNHLCDEPNTQGKIARPHKNQVLDSATQIRQA